MASNVVFKIYAEHLRIKSYFDNMVLFAESVRLIKKHIPPEAEFSFHLSYSKKKSVKTKATFPSYVFLRKDNAFLTVTPKGSWAKIYYLSRKVVCKLQKEDEWTNMMIGSLFTWSSVLANAFRVHSVWLQVKGKAVLLLGKSGAGKTTLARLLTNYNKKFKILTDDATIIFPKEKNIYAV